MFRIITFNANGIRSASRKGFLTWLRTMSPDVLCMQELKAQESDLTDDLRTPLGFHGYFHCAQKKGYSGCGLWSRVNPFAVLRRLLAGYGAGGRPVLSSQLADALEVAPGKSGMGWYNRFGE